MYAVATTVLVGRLVAVTGSEDATVRIWDLTSGALLGEPLTGHTDGVLLLLSLLSVGRKWPHSQSSSAATANWPF